MKLNAPRNPAMVMDLYELTMSYGYFKECDWNTKVAFDVFYRKNPDGGGYAIAAGLEQIIDYIGNLHFEETDITYLRSLNLFGEDFLAYLQGFSFKGDLYAFPEGTVIYPNEPVITVVAPMIDAQIVETSLLLHFNHQSLIATKTSRIVRAADGRPVSDMGARRAHNMDAAVYGARAAYIGGVAGTATILAGQMFGIPAVGTMAHSWVMGFPDEFTAFSSYAKTYPDSTVLLVDTYNVIESGIPNAIRVFNEVLAPKGIRKCGIRIDSGDITYLTKKVRKMLDDAGWTECRIVISNSLDEYLIRELIRQGAEVDAFGVGERLITAKSDPVFGGVYKLCAVEKDDGTIIPKIKISENVGKITTPHFKKVYRLRGRDTGKAEADLICVWDETVDDTKPLEIFDPHHTWKRKTIENFVAEELKNGKQVYELPKLADIRQHCADEIAGMWDEVRRFNNPHNYYVDLSQKLWDIKTNMLKARGAYHPETREE